MLNNIVDKCSRVIVNPRFVTDNLKTETPPFYCLVVIGDPTTRSKRVDDMVTRTAMIDDRLTLVLTLSPTLTLPGIRRSSYDAYSSGRPSRTISREGPRPDLSVSASATKGENHDRPKNDGDLGDRDGPPGTVGEVGDRATPSAATGASAILPAPAALASVALETLGTVETENVRTAANITAVAGGSGNIETVGEIADVGPVCSDSISSDSIDSDSIDVNTVTGVDNKGLPVSSNDNIAAADVTVEVANTSSEDPGGKANKNGL